MRSLQEILGALGGTATGVGVPARSDGQECFRTEGARLFVRSTDKHWGDRYAVNQSEVVGVMISPEVVGGGSQVRMGVVAHHTAHLNVIFSVKRFCDTPTWQTSEWWVG